MLALLMLFALQDVGYDDLKPGDRIEIQFESGHSVRGMLIIPENAPKGYSFENTDKLVLDLTLEHMRMGKGTMGVSKLNIDKLRKLPPISPEEARAILRKKNIALDKLSAEEQERIRQLENRIAEFHKGRQRAAEEGGPKGEGDLYEEDLTAEQKEALEFYRKYPEEEGWNEAKAAELEKFLIKSEGGYLDIRQGTTGPGGATVYPKADPKEAEFLSNFELWKKGRDIAGRLTEKPKGGGEEGKKTPGEGEEPEEASDVEKAYRSMLAALKAMDMEQLAKWADASTIRQLKEIENPESVLKAMADKHPTSVKVMKETVSGGTAELTVVGKKGGNDIEGTVFLVFEGGGWKVSEWRWGSKAPGKAATVDHLESVYKKFRAALSEGDVAALKGMTVDPQILKAINDAPDAEEVLKKLAPSLPQIDRYVEVKGSGDTRTLVTEATMQMPGQGSVPVKGRIQFKLEDGAWKVAGQKWDRGE